MPHNDQAPVATPSRRGILFKTIMVLLALVAILALCLLRIYKVETHHTTRNSIWWTARGKSLIPPSASDIILQQDLLDHYATYTITEKELNAFLDKRFARDGGTLDSFSERGRPAPEKIGKPIGRLAWVVTADTVVYDYTTSNGAASSYYHDPTTGHTYQSSAYW